jgi:hypothetical protein
MSVLGTMTPAKENYEIPFTIPSRLAPANHAMELESIAPAAVLAFPAIPLQDLQPQFLRQSLELLECCPAQRWPDPLRDTRIIKSTDT